MKRWSSPVPTLIPAFERPTTLAGASIAVRFSEACAAWLARSPSVETCTAYLRELKEFLRFAVIAQEQLSDLTRVRPQHIASFRDHLKVRGLGNAAIVRKITVLRSLFSYIRIYGYTGPTRPIATSWRLLRFRGKTVALSPHDCRRLLDAPDLSTPMSLRDRALLAVLAFTGCRVGELTRLRVADYKTTGTHRVVEIRGKGGKERPVPVHPEAAERLETCSTFLGSAPMLPPHSFPHREPRAVAGMSIASKKIADFAG